MDAPRDPGPLYVMLLLVSHQTALLQCCHRDLSYTNTALAIPLLTAAAKN